MREAAIDQRVLPRDRHDRTRKRRILPASLALLTRVVRTYPARTIAAAVFGTMLAGIVFNAVLFQKGRHPAPLFGSAPHVRMTQASTAPARPHLSRPPAGVPAPLQAPAVGQAVRVNEPVPSARPIAGAGSSPVRKEDGIAQLLRGDGKPPSEPTGAKPPLANVLLAQRALQKLGYEVTPDGQMGAATRQALEKFEHDRHLSAGHLSAGADLSPKLLHELTGAAGLRRG